MSKQILIAALLLGGFAVFGTSLLSGVHQTTYERIAANEQALLLKRLNEIVPAGYYDNDLQTDIKQIESALEFGITTPLTIYLARQNQAAVAAVVSTVAPDGYSGKIKLLVGITYDGEILGVRAVAHKETPGLGDGIETSRSDWVLGFNGKSLTNPDSRAAWAVKPDGGNFDAFTGATITPRAVVKAVHKTLQYFAQEKTALFAGDAIMTVPSTETSPAKNHLEQSQL